MIGAFFITAGLLIVWAYRALNFPWFETAERLPNGAFSYSAVPPRLESELIASAAFRAGILWIDEFILHDGIGVAFGPFNRYAVLEAGEFPYWYVVDAGTWDGQRGAFDFQTSASQASADNP